MAQRPRMPWEGVGFTALALGAMDPPAWLFEPRVPQLPPLPPRPQQGEPLPRPRLPAAGTIKRRKLYASVVDGNSDDERALQIAKWLELLEMGLLSSEIGRNIVQAQETRDADDIINIVNDALARKATGTLATWAIALFMFLHWFRRVAASGDPPFPFSETRVYS